MNFRVELAEAVSDYEEIGIDLSELIFTYDDFLNCNRKDMSSLDDIPKILRAKSILASMRFFIHKILNLKSEEFSTMMEFSGRIDKRFGTLSEDIKQEGRYVQLIKIKDHQNFMLEALQTLILNPIFFPQREFQNSWKKENREKIIKSMTEILLIGYMQSGAITREEKTSIQKIVNIRADGESDETSEESETEIPPQKIEEIKDTKRHKEKPEKEVDIGEMMEDV